MIGKPPFEAIAGNQPDLNSLSSFRFRIHARKPGKIPAKLDHHTFNRIFLRYTATMRSVYYIDDITDTIKVGAHAIFDKAHFTVPKLEAPISDQVYKHWDITSLKRFLKREISYQRPQ